MSTHLRYPSYSGIAAASQNSIVSLANSNFKISITPLTFNPAKKPASVVLCNSLIGISITKMNRSGDAGSCLKPLSY